MNTLNEIDRYIAGFPEETQKLLHQLREVVRKAAPEAREVMSYGMPAFKMKRVLVYFAAHKNHIGFYPTNSGIDAFKNELRGFIFSKGAVQFPLDKPLPLELISKMVRFRIEEDKNM